MFVEEEKSKVLLNTVYPTRNKFCNSQQKVTKKEAKKETIKNELKKSERAS